MKLAKKSNLIAGLDIGSSKICTLIAELSDENINVLGMGVSQTEGYRRGGVTSLAMLVDSIRSSVQKAEAEAQAALESVFVTTGGGPLPGMNMVGSANIKGKAREVSQDDIYDVIDVAKNFKIPDGMVILHVLPQEFTLDGQTGISDPLGMTGEQLEVRIHVLLNAATGVQNIVNAVNKSGLIVAGTVMPQVASALAVLTADEKELGAAMIDIGGGSTDIAVFLRGGPWHSESIPMGGNHFTKDTSIGLRAPLGEADRLKREHGCAHASLVTLEELLEVRSIAGNSVRLVSREMLCQIIQARAEELFGLVNERLESWGCRRELVAGAVITGGMAALEGMDVVAEQVLGMPVRVGCTAGSFELGDISSNPAYSAAAGLLIYGRNVLRGHEQKVVRPAISHGLLEKASGKMRYWFSQLMA
ncbi:MAG: cell division protein FtsA [Acidobacteria bacterium]|nr:cell division protein FtsA [Acidobacteriota bacterium]